MHSKNYRLNMYIFVIFLYVYLKKNIFCLIIVYIKLQARFKIIIKIYLEMTINIKT